MEEKKSFPKNESFVRKYFPVKKKKKNEVLVLLSSERNINTKS